MIDWLATYTADFEFFELDPGTWQETRRLDGMSGFSVERDSTLDTIETATVTSGESLTDKWFRAYLAATQDGRTERVCLATCCCKSSTRKFGGARGVYYECDCYSALEPLKLCNVEPGRTVPLADPLESARQVMEECGPAPVSPGWEVDLGPFDKGKEHYTADPDDLSALTLVKALCAKANARLAVDPYGRIRFEPVRDPASLQSGWEFCDRPGETVVYSDLDEGDDTADIPNAMTVYDEASGLVGHAVNDSPSSRVSTVSRGYRQDGDPSDAVIPAKPTQAVVDAEALRLLKLQSRAQHEVRLSHGYCGIELGQGASVEHGDAGLTGIVGEVTYTKVEATTELKCETTVSYTEDLWEVS